MERLTQRTKDGIVGNNNGVENFPLYSLYDETHLDHGLIEQCFNKLAEYEDAEDQGLILRLPAPLDGVESFKIADKGIWLKVPCQIGDTVYEIDGITWKGHDWKYRSYKNAFVKETVFRLEMLSEIGKTVFLTKEEAEQALARMEGEDV